MERAKYNRSSSSQRGPPGNPPRGTGCAEKPQTEVRGPTRKLTITPDPNGSFRLRTNETRPRRGDTIAKVGNPSGEEDPLEQGELEPDGGRRTGKKPRNRKAQQAVCSQPQVQQGSTPKSPGKVAEEARRRQGTGKYSDKPGKNVVTSH